MLNRSHHHSSTDSDSAPTTASRLAIPPRADASTSTSSARMPNSSRMSNSSSGCVSIAAMRSELQRATELAAADDACPLQQRQSTATRMMGRHHHHHHLASPSSFSTSKDRVLGSWSGEDPARGDDDDGDEGDEGDDVELKMQMRRLRFSAEGSGAQRPADDEDDDDDCCYLVDSPELAAFLGMTISAAAIAVQQQQQHFAPSLVKAASFSGRYQHANNSQQQQQTRLPPLQQRGMMVPCSPPVPIPRKQLLRRRNSVTGSLLSTSRQNRGCDASLLVDASGVERTYSRTQCEARLWDEDWNFKLSLEARESFERSTSRSSLSANDENGGSNDCSPNSQQRPRRERGRSECGTTSSSSRAGVWKPQSTSSLTSTADTTREDDSGGSDFDADNDDGDCSDVFDMDDL